MQVFGVSLHASGKLCAWSDILDSDKGNQEGRYRRKIKLFSTKEGHQSLVQKLPIFSPANYSLRSLGPGPPRTDRRRRAR